MEHWNPPNNPAARTKKNASSQIQSSQLAALYSILVSLPSASVISETSLSRALSVFVFSDPLSNFTISLRHPTTLTASFHFHPAPWHRGAEQSSLRSCPPLPASAPTFCQPSCFFFLLVIISTVFLMVLVGVLLAIEHAYVMLWTFGFKMRGAVYLCACGLRSRLCTRAGIYTAGAESTTVVCISGLGRWTWTLYGCDVVRMECV